VALRVVLAEDNFLLREGVRKLIEAQDDLELVAVCDDFDSLLAAIDTDAPDVVLTDIRMPPSGTDEGIRAAAHLREVNPEAGVVVLSERAVEKHINSIFSKLGLSEEKDTHRRVKAVLLYLAETQGDGG